MGARINNESTRVEKSYVGTHMQEFRTPFDLNLIRISPEFFIDLKIEFLPYPS